MTIRPVVLDDAAYPRRGIGSALYQRIDARLRGFGADVVRTQVNDENGCAFVEHRGFTRTNVMRLQSPSILVEHHEKQGV